MLGAKKKPSEPGLLRVMCPVVNCSVIHRVPVNLSSQITIDSEGTLELQVYPDPDVSAFVDHLAFEHGMY